MNFCYSISLTNNKCIMSTAEVFCEKFKMAFGNLKRIKKKHMNKLIQDYAM